MSSVVSELVANSNFSLATAEPYVDEFFSGYAGRVSNINGASSIHDLRTAIVGHGGRTQGKNYLLFLAAVASLPPDDFVQLHTAFRFNTAVGASSGSGAAPFATWGGSRVRQLYTRTGHLRYCPQCAAEDLEFWKVSYWRTAHQFPGLDWCIKHGNSLNVTPFSTIGPCYLSPSDIETSSTHQANFYPIDHSSLFLRYAAILVGILELHGRLSNQAFVDTIRARALECGIGGHKHTGMQQLLGRLTSAATLAWVESVVGMRKWQEMLTWAIRCHRYSARSTRPEIFTLLLALLFPSADIALIALLTNSRKSAPDAT